MNFTIQFNFCSYVSKKCYDKNPSYLMAVYNSTDCFYMGQPNTNVSMYTPIKNGTTLGLRMTLGDVRETNTSLVMDVICDRNATNLTFVSQKYVVLEQTFYLTYKSAKICPQQVYNVIWENLSSLSWLFLIIGLVIGPLELLLGYKVFRITIFIVG